MSCPSDLKYSKDHEWARVDGNICTIGITDHAQCELGDIVYVDIDESLTEVTVGANFGTIEAVKAVSDLLSPVTGKVVEINNGLNADPAVVNSDPYGAGWMIKVEMSNPSEIDNLMSADDYMNFI